jgi:hypothetical protein
LALTAAPNLILADRRPATLVLMTASRHFPERRGEAPAEHFQQDSTMQMKQEVMEGSLAEHCECTLLNSCRKKLSKKSSALLLF